MYERWLKFQEKMKALDEAKAKIKEVSVLSKFSLFFCKKIIKTISVWYIHGNWVSGSKPHSEGEVTGNEPHFEIVVTGNKCHSELEVF